jgi:hypothetical protein
MTLGAPPSAATHIATAGITASARSRLGESRYAVRVDLAATKGDSLSRPFPVLHKGRGEIGDRK